MKTKIEELINHLRGSYLGLQEGMDDIDYPTIELSDKDAQILDQEIFNCEVCGWWFDISEMGAEDMICENCSPGHWDE